MYITVTVLLMGSGWIEGTQDWLIPTYMYY